MYTIQLAHAMGLAVATTASLKHKELLEGYGADIVLDYRDPDAPAQLKKWGDAHGGIQHALDCISEFGARLLA